MPDRCYYCYAGGVAQGGASGAAAAGAAGVASAGGAAAQGGASVAPGAGVAGGAGCGGVCTGGEAGTDGSPATGWFHGALASGWSGSGATGATTGASAGATGGVAKPPEGGPPTEAPARMKPLTKLELPYFSLFSTPTFAISGIPNNWLTSCTCNTPQP